MVCGSQLAQNTKAMIAASSRPSTQASEAGKPARRRKTGAPMPTSAYPSMNPKAGRNHRAAPVRQSLVVQVAAPTVTVIRAWPAKSALKVATMAATPDLVTPSC
jgi:hypothetical protein